MSEATALDTVLETVLQHASQPFTATQYAMWQRRVVEAYRNLGMSPDFRLLLQDWTKQVLLNKEASTGAKDFVIDLVWTMHNAQRALHEREVA